jgi:glycerophosphoryl diester phosphodiesterase
VALRRVRLLAPALPTVLLRDKLPLELPPVGTRILGPSCAALRSDPEGVARLHRAGCQLYVWTVDQPDDIALALELGVDAIISNRPRDVLAARAGRSPGPRGDAGAASGP